MFTCAGQAARSKYCRRQESASQIGMGAKRSPDGARTKSGIFIGRCRRVAKSASEELPDHRGDLVTVRLEGEVAGVEEAHVSVRDITLERLGARRQEERVVLAPSCQERRLVLAKI